MITPDTQEQRKSDQQEEEGGGHGHHGHHHSDNPLDWLRDSIPGSMLIVFFKILVLLYDYNVKIHNSDNSILNISIFICLRGARR